GRRVELVPVTLYAHHMPDRVGIVWVGLIDVTLRDRGWRVSSRYVEPAGEGYDRVIGDTRQRGLDFQPANTADNIVIARLPGCPGSGGGPRGGLRVAGPGGGP